MAKKRVATKIPAEAKAEAKVESGAKAKAEEMAGAKAEAEEKTEAKVEAEEQVEEKAEVTEEAPKEEPKEAAPADDEKYLRLMAEFQNYKRRVEKEKEDIRSYGSEKLVLQLVEVLDNFDRALQSQSADAAFTDGMTLIFKQLSDVLGKNGVEEVKALGEEFDPNYHNAVMMEDSADYESGKVSAVLQKGYTLNGKVVRPAMVKVAN